MKRYSFEMEKIFLFLVLFAVLLNWYPPLTNDEEFASFIWYNTSLSHYLLQKAANHQIYKSIANGTLNMSNFLGFMQQDDIYITNMYDSVQIIYDRVPQSDTYTRNELVEILKGRSFYRDTFNRFYNQSGVNITFPKQVQPVTVGMVLLSN